MIFFVPAWYTDASHWWTERIPWYREKKRKYDSFLSQIRMFLHEGEEVCLLNLSQFTGYRRFAFAEGLGKAAQISVFDILQNIGLNECASYSYKDLPWASGMEWVYTPFLVWGYQNGERKVKIEFAKAGDVAEILFYDGEKVHMKYRLDERGFISVVLIYGENTQPYAYYLDAGGRIQFRENQEDGRVEIALGAAYAFKKRRYDDLGELVEEALSEQLSKLTGSDTVVVSSHPRNNALFLKENRPFKTVLFLEGESAARCSTDELQAADLLVTDSEWDRKRILSRCPDLRPDFMVIAPVDARLDWGKSSETRIQKIFLHADIPDDHELGVVLTAVAEFLRADDNIELYVVEEFAPERGSDAQKEALCARIEAVSDLRVDREEEKSLGENRELQEMLEEERDKVYVRSYSDIQELEKILYDCRLIADLGEEPSELLQIVGISMGIPQIHKVSTRYIDHRKEGYVIGELDKLPEAMRYYLYGIQNWNEAFMHCVRKVEAYSGKAIVEKWMNHIDSVRR